MKLSYLEGSAFLSLAPELIQYISNELDVSNVKQLRLTCKAMAETLHAEIFRMLILRITMRNVEKNVQRIESLSTGNHAVCRAARVLTIRSLSLTFESIRECYRGASKPSLTAENASRVAIAEGKIAAHLFDAISSLKGVHSVRWMPSSKDGQSIYRIVLDALKTLPSLRRFRVHFSNSTMPLELDALRGLDEIAISTQHTSEPYQGEVYDNLAKAIALNPSLRSIDITGIRWNVQGSNFRSLHHLFKCYPAIAPPLRLRNLRLCSFILPLSITTEPHLAHLTSLSLTNINDPIDTISRYGHRFDEIDQKLPELIQEIKPSESPLEDFWKMLRVAGVQLKTITVENVPYSFLQYLSSYSGLKELHLSPGGFKNGASSNVIAVRFFDGRLNSHLQSLENLQIFAEYEGLWCFGSHNIEMISKLGKLKHLGVSINTSDLKNCDKKKDQGAPLLMPTAIKVLFDMAVVCMPNIQNLHVISAELEAHRGARCGTGAVGISEKVYQSLVEAVGSYTAPPLCQRLPSVRVGDLTLFVGEHSFSHDSTPMQKEDVKSGAQGPGTLKYVSKAPKDSMRKWSEFLGR